MLFTLFIYILLEFQSKMVCCLKISTYLRKRTVSPIFSTKDSGITVTAGGIWKSKNIRQTLHEKYPYSRLFWSVFFHIWTEYGEMRSKSPYSVRLWENTVKNNSEYGHFLRRQNCSVS